MIAIPLLIVPALSKAGDAGVITAGSNVTCKSYESTPKPVKLPVVIGIEMTPGEGLKFGSDTDTVVSAGSEFEKTGDSGFCRPKN